MPQPHDNPFRPPAAELRERSPGSAQALYRPAAVGIATFFGTPLAGAWVLSRNLQRLGLENRIGPCWWTSIGLCFVIVALSLLLPEKFPALPVTVVQVVVMQQYARQVLGAALQRHQEAGGAFLSNWRAFGVALLFLLAVLTLVLFGAFILGLTART